MYFSKSLVVRISIFHSLQDFFLLVCIYQGGKVYESGIGCILSRELVPSHLVDLSTNNSSSIFALWIRILWISKNNIMNIELGPSHWVDLLNNNSLSILAVLIRILWVSIAWKILLTENKQTSLIEYYYEHKHVPFHLVVFD